MEQGQPKLKRMKLDQEVGEGHRVTEASKKKDREIKTEAASKRGGQEGKQRTPKKARPNHNIKKYISCKKWRLEDEEQEQQPGEMSSSPSQLHDDPQPAEMGEQGHHHPQQPHHELGEGEPARMGVGEEAVKSACSYGMPGSRVQASPGGTSPSTEIIPILTLRGESLMSKEKGLKG